MIKGLSGSNRVLVDGGNTSLPYTSPLQGDTFSGVLRINNGNIEYCQSGGWQVLPSSYATVRLDASTEALLTWVQQKRDEEYNRDLARRNLEEKAKTHPALAKAFGAIKRAEAKRDAEVTKAQENFLVLEKLIGDEQAMEYQDEKSI